MSPSGKWKSCLLLAVLVMGTCLTSFTSDMWEKTWALLQGESHLLLPVLTANCPNAKSELISGSITEFVNLGKQFNIHGLNFSFAQQRENASIFCSFPVKTYFVVGTLLLICY